ncbi:hypothetical protein P7K49_036626 [Saguinus oedipus]|uniref:Uncharacterized protein n=1 Tax=Saguinus oedipus TaxID=9490 RepID=A0ABQ9TKX2_SAGOE|nr:hypothetical protein P7K49_036626 [Saguinus oedipus]
MASQEPALLLRQPSPVGRLHYGNRPPALLRASVSSVHPGKCTHSASLKNYKSQKPMERHPNGQPPGRGPGHHWLRRHEGARSCSPHQVLSLREAPDARPLQIRGGEPGLRGAGRSRLRCRTLTALPPAFRVDGMCSRYSQDRGSGTIAD